ncbi:Predicted DNA-binding transcriptional regulator YafY, contains an HTH and WYL domains [Quadrisphaera granulorum]|uniref:Putative DNA-binding transcriptional regulator YafY n=1 Tax=Quadrisphaera granulorum TaxID=317664 RepID=A0A315ZLJ7_9ACTN|nr:WYL domain-containing protein [Quadrisphaera granulorum]PWJ46495.1 putative DNA-binding transcriptional regulator YafY [Quadrisphaera granulorum]SZE99053.1 Predicted DNA-binding transcriptional regulator YafY, contains an HTH and WYL domains [Quadrisphaera granulorum]
MKASRLLNLLLLLQTRERMTTSELAEQLEVSRRTVLRDVEALSAAGVPVYAERGRRGGVVLLSGARLNASHLEPAELEALSLTGLDAAHLEELGLAAATVQATRKLAARRARTPTRGEPADLVPLSELVVSDNTGWRSAAADVVVDIGGLALDVRRRRRLALSYRRSGAAAPSPVTVNPYGLASKAGRWYLVADVEGEPRLFAVERISACEALDEPAALRDGESLASVWRELAARVEGPGGVVVQARLRTERLDLARRVLGSRLAEVRSEDGEWSRVTVSYDDVESVRQLLQLGDHVEVVAPEEVRRRVRELALDLAARHTAAPS